MSQLKIIPVFLLLLTLAACKSSDSVPTSGSLDDQSPQQEVTTAYPPPDQEMAEILPPTNTPTPAALVEVTEENTHPLGNSELEIRIPFDIYNPDLETAGDLAECITILPFTLEDQQGRTMVEGQELIQCEFIDTPQDTPIIYHILLAFDASLSGELLPATPEYPHGWLDAFLNIDGTISQYYEGYPPEATNPCPQTEPCRTPASEVIPLPFPYQDGSVITTPWTFVLHLPEGEQK
jgi:hypothetical protein